MLRTSTKGKRLALTGIVGCLIALCLAITPADARKHRKAHRSAGYNPPYSDMVVDAKTGKILHSVNPDALRHPASLTKVMTLYLLFERLERGSMTINTELKVSSHASSQAPTKLGLRPGQTLEVEDAIKGIVTRSANDAAVTIAENIGGSESAFANMMTQKARALGMSRTTYRNASGLPNPGQVTTARDQTILARAIQDRFPKYYAYFQTRSFEYGNQVIGNHNRLLGRVEGVDGIKTGYTRASGFNLMTNARTADRHVVGVVLGGRTAAARDNQMVSLIESGLQRAYAGARQTPVIAEHTPSRRTTVAKADLNSLEEDEVDTTASTAVSQTPTPPAITAPMRRAAADKQIRAVVASASSAASTATPTVTTTPNLRWKTGAPAALPANARAYTAPARDTQSELTKMLAKDNARKTQAAEAVSTKPVVSGWIIQLGAPDSEAKAKALLANAKDKSGKALAKASPFTEKINSAGTTLYRARFAGFSEQTDARNACSALKRSGFTCFASRG